MEDLGFPVVMKASIGPHGGRAVRFPDGPEELLYLMHGESDFVVQRYIKQHSFFDRFNSHGLNTLRACTYRSVRDGEIHILNVALRMGVGGSLDNETQGGIVCYVDEQGRLNDYAVDKYGGRFLAHPNSGLVFRDQESIPNFQQMKELVGEIAESVYLRNVVSLDLCLDSGGFWRMVEVNVGHHTIRFSQYAGRPFFGPFTEEVIEYCEDNPRWC